MFPSARQAIACVFIIFIAFVVACSQVTPGKTASVSGKVTLKNKPLVGVVVNARNLNVAGADRSRYRATTDQNGAYKIANLPPGTYEVAPLALSLVADDELRPKSLVVEEADAIENVNFAMAPGGVITGRITDADGQPLVEQQVFLHAVEGPAAQTSFFRGGIITDDRGVYRVFGLREGKYKISVGQSESRLPRSSRFYAETFYPSVTDAAKASVVDVTAGGEVTDIDIVMGRPVTGFKVTGKIVDRDTGKPVPNIKYGIFRSMGGGSGESTGGAGSDANGEFKFEGVTPGKYSVFVMMDQSANIRAEWVPFEVVDHDVSGLVLKTVPASSVSGVVMVEGIEDQSAVAKFGNLYVHALLDVRESQWQGSPGVDVGPDGSFTIKGLLPGIARFGVSPRGPAGNKLSLVRVERDGIPQPNGVSIKDGEQIAGIRLVLKPLTGTIRGVVKIEDGELPPNGRISLWISVPDENRSTSAVVNTGSNPQVDSRGRFLIEGLAAGTYEINVAIFEAGRIDTSRIVKQQVAVTDNAVSEVAVTLRLKP